VAAEQKVRLIQNLKACIAGERTSAEKIRRIDMFIRLELNDGSGHEWGWNSDIAPIVGDIVWLYYEIPDEEPTGNFYLEAVVTKRQIMIQDHEGDEEDEIWITAISINGVPDGYVADSPAWPSKEVSVRHEELQRDLLNIRSKSSERPKGAWQ
jgi:hypothetical protein